MSFEPEIIPINDALKRMLAMKNARKVLFLSTVIPLFLTALIALSERFSYYMERYLHLDSVQTMFALAICSIFFGSLYYLQYGGEKGGERNEQKMEYDSALFELKKSNDWLASNINKIQNDYKDLKSSVFDKSVTQLDISDEDKDKILTDVSQKLQSDEIKAQMVSFETSIRSSLESEIKKKQLGDLFRETVLRLNRAISDQKVRGNINLAIGITITAGGLYLLWSTVEQFGKFPIFTDLLKKDPNIAIVELFKVALISFVPRLSLVIFIEIFAYFFLRLYKTGLYDIKYFQNELTNIEVKNAAFIAAMTADDAPLKAHVIESLCKIDRNHILDKGQTTVDLERARADGELSKQLVAAIPGIFGNAGSSKIKKD